MTLEELVRAQVEAFNRHDVAGFVACYAPQAEVRDPQYPEPLVGTAALGKDIQAWFSAFPDVKGQALRTVADGEAYAVEWTMQGTHTGPLLMPDGSSVKATNQAVRFTAALFGRVGPNGRILEERRYYDLAGVMGQLGLMK